MSPLTAGVLLGLVTIAVVAPAASGVLYGKSHFPDNDYYPDNSYNRPGHKKKQKEQPHDPCEHFVCTTGKDGRRTFCRVAHICDKLNNDPNDVACNFTLPVCVNRASEDSYYDYGPQYSVCKKGNPVIHLSTGEDKVCDGDTDCPMGYECVDPDDGDLTNVEGVCCLAPKEMDPHPTCPKVKVYIPPVQKKRRRRGRKRGRYAQQTSYESPFYKYNVCMTKCYTEYDCDYGEICCNTGCGYKCIELDETTTSSTTSTTSTTTAPPTTTTPLTTTTTTIAPTTTTASTAPFVAGTSARVAASTGDGSLGGPITQSTPRPGGGAIGGVGGGAFGGGGPRQGGPVHTSSRCPLDPEEIICGQILCYSDNDCPDEEVCCGSLTCNKKYNKGSTCLRPLQKKKAGSSGLFGNPLLGKQSFGAFAYDAPSFGGSFGGSYKPKSAGRQRSTLTSYPKFPKSKDDEHSSSHAYPKFPKTSKSEDDEHNYPKFPKLYQEEPNTFNSYDKSSPFASSKSSPFESSPFGSIGYPQKQSYELPKFGFGYNDKKKKKSSSEYDGHSMEEYGDDEDDDPMYGRDGGFFLKKKK